MEYQGDKSTFQAVPLERLPRGRPVSNALRHLRRQRTPRRRSFFQVHLSRDLSFGSRHSIWNRFLDLLASWGAPGRIPSWIPKIKSSSFYKLKAI